MSDGMSYNDVVRYVRDVEVEDRYLSMYELALPDYLARVVVDVVERRIVIVGDVEYFKVPEIKWEPVDNDTEALRECIIQLIEKFEIERKS